MKNALFAAAVALSGALLMPSATLAQGRPTTAGPGQVAPDSRVFRATDESQRHPHHNPRHRVCHWQRGAHGHRHRLCNWQ